jgi:flagellar biosynthesis GTPase FlhF
MQVKKFQADSMPEVLKMVKAEFGLEAMILNTRKERRKGILSFFRKPYVEVTAAIDTSSAGRHKRDPEPEETPANTREEFRNAMLEPLVREIKQLKDKVEFLFEKESASVNSSRRLFEDSITEWERENDNEEAALKKSGGFEKVLWQTSNIQADFPIRTPDGVTFQSEEKRIKVNQSVLDACADEFQQNRIDTEIADINLKKSAPLIGREQKRTGIDKGMTRLPLESLEDFTGSEGTGNEERRFIALFGPI